MYNTKIKSRKLIYINIIWLMIFCSLYYRFLFQLTFLKTALLLKRCVHPCFLIIQSTQVLCNSMVIVSRASKECQLKFFKCHISGCNSKKGFLLISKKIQQLVDIGCLFLSKEHNKATISALKMKFHRYC